MSDQSPRQPRGWHFRGYLPHFDAGEEHTQSVTFRLADSLPAAVVESWRSELAGKPRDTAHRLLWERAEAYLDRGLGACHLRDPRAAQSVQSALLHFSGERYDLHGWVVMPNHVHALFTPSVGWSLTDILHSWKSFTAKQVNRLLGLRGQLWQEDYFDRFVRDEKHFADALDYIHDNPVKAGLCQRAEEWPYSSARFRRGEGEAGGTPALRQEGLR